MPKFSRLSGPPVVLAVSICATANTLIFAERPMNNRLRKALTPGDVFDSPGWRTSDQWSRSCVIVAFSSSAMTNTRSPGSQPSSSCMARVLRSLARAASLIRAACICSGVVQ
jgi:hypothetical protein